MERKPPLNSELAARKFGSAGLTYPGVVVAVVTPTALNTFPLLSPKLGWFSTLKTSTFARKYFPSVKWNSLPTERFRTLKPGLYKEFRATLVRTPFPASMYLAVVSAIMLGVCANLFASTATYPTVLSPTGQLAAVTL